MTPGADIHKAAGILITDRRLLVTRTRGKSFFVSPGGKVEAGELPELALTRELKEELSLSVTPSDLEHFGTFTAPAAGEEDRQLVMDTYIVTHWDGEIQPDSEIEEIAWIASDFSQGMELGSIFAHEVIPRLKEQDLID